MVSLQEAVSQNSIQQVEKLIQEGADVNQEVFDFRGTPCTLLHIAASEGYEKIVELLISNGALIEARNFHGKTPLYQAQCGNFRILREVNFDNFEASKNRYFDHFSRSEFEY